MVDEESLEAANAPNSSVLSASTVPSKAKATVAQQEREFQKAVQPGSPISALLSSARQPLVVSTNVTREQPLIRKLQTAAKEKRAAALAESNTVPELGNRIPGGLQHISEEDGELAEEPYRNRELESQKARIVAQMVPGAVGPTPTVAITGSEANVYVHGPEGAVMQMPPGMLTRIWVMLFAIFVMPVRELMKVVGALLRTIMSLITGLLINGALSPQQRPICCFLLVCGK